MSSDTEQKGAEKMRAGFVALLGLPNSGKSTLANALVGEKVSIVSSKPQTTRRRIHGIYTDKHSQIVFVDSPGIVGPTTSLNQFLNLEYKAVLRDCDAILVVVHLDATEPDFIERLIEVAKQARKPWAIVATKSDLAPEHRLNFIRSQCTMLKVPSAVVSAQVDVKSTRRDVLALIRPLLPESDTHLFDPDTYTTENMRQVAAEWIREEAFERLSQEVPYSLAVRVTEFKEPQQGTVRIRADLLVERENHKMIVIGKGGQMIKSIGVAARQKLEGVMGRSIFLDLRVIVRPNWTENPRLMQELGYATSQS